MNSPFRFKTLQLFAVSLMLWCRSAEAGSFAGDSRIEITDSSGGLSWVPANNALTVSCWFKLSVPSSVSLSQNMTVLVNRRTGSDTDPHAFLIEFNASTGKVEFSTRGDTGIFTNALIDKPYLDRWYHVAVVRNGGNITGYVDGFQMFSEAVTVGTSATTDGVSVGGWGGARPLYGEVQEVAIYQSALSQEFIVGNMFTDQPVALSSLVGYYKLGATNSLVNSAQTPPAGTNPATAQGPVTFEATNQLGEQSAFDSRRNAGRDAVATLSGAFSWDQGAISRPTPGVPFEFRYGYASGNAFNSSTLGGFNPFNDSKLGSGWKHTFDARIVPSQYFSPAGGLDSIGLMLWDGSLEVWDYNFLTDLYEPRHGEYRGELRIVSASTCEWTTPNRLIYKFRHPYSGSTLMRGRLLEIRDFNGNVLTVNWDQTLGRVASVTDTAGGVWTFTYTAQDRLANVSGPNNDPLQKWTLTFSYDAQNRLATKTITGPVAYTATPPLNTQWRFFYNAASGLLERINDPRAKDAVTIVYDKYGRRTTETDAEGHDTVFAFNIPANRQITTTDPAGKKWIESYDRRGRIEEKKDPLGNRTTFERDAAGNVAAVVEPDGNATVAVGDWRTEFTYDARANILTKKDALGRVWTWEYSAILTGGTPLNKPTKERRPKTGTEAADWETRYTYDGAGNLTKQEDDIGTLAEHTYGNVPLATAGFTAKGLALSSKDANQHQTTFTYNGNGFLASRTEAVGTPQAATWNFTRSELGWTLTETNALTQTSTLSYNINGQVTQVLDPLGHTTKKDYDPDGNLVGEFDAKNQQTQYLYDNTNRLVETIDRAGNHWEQAWNSRGKLASASRTALNNYTTYFAYDVAARLQTETDPSDKFVTHEYDANGNETAFVDKLGQRWEKTYDGLNRVIANKDPLGNTSITTYDEAGRIKTVTNPRGFTQTHDYDGRGRLVKWTDAQGFVWLYTYDGVGNVLDIEDALHGHYVMTYGPRNERLTERNQDNKQWIYSYDELLRLKTQTDPNGVTRTLNYDNGGRVTSVAFSTGRIHTFSYDDNNNPLTITRTVGGVDTTSTLTYDPMDRVATSTDAFNQTVGYTYDNRGQVKTIIYPGNKVLTREYGALSRLTKLTDWNGRITTFGYDDADRLTARTYPNGVTQTVAYDSAGRLSTLANGNTAGPAIALSYAYDRNGNKTSSTERGLLRPPLPAAINETANYSPAGRLQTRIDADEPAHAKDFNYTYDESGNMTQAASAGQSYAFGYDEDNRVTGVIATGTTAAAITNRYDAVGRRIARTLGGVETRYVLDLASGMERILCATDASGTVLTRYVHAADLCYKEDAQTGAITCYHADAQGNIVRTTDSARATGSEYAYTPYGRLLGQNGPAPDAYRFVGSQGVMEELPNVYFMRARYYSAEAGIFLSTDPVKNIGPGWKPESYGYAAGNPVLFTDANGEFIGAYWLAEQTIGREINEGLSAVELLSGSIAGTLTDDDREDAAVEITVKSAATLSGPLGAIATDFAIGASVKAAGGGNGKLKEATIGAIPFGQTALGVAKAYNILGNVTLIVVDKVAPAVANVVSDNIKGMSAARGPQGPNAKSTPMWLGDVGRLTSPQGSAELVAARVAPAVNQAQATKTAPPTNSSSINLSDPKTQQQLAQISNTLNQISKLLAQLQKQVQAAQKAKTSTSKGKK